MTDAIATDLTDIEAVFRSLKSELGLRPIFHHLARLRQLSVKTAIGH